MTTAEYKKLKLLCSKMRLESANRYLMTEEEKAELKKLSSEYEDLDDGISKAIFYMHDFLGIGFFDIAEILHYTYQSTRNRYYEIKTILIQE